MMNTDRPAAFARTVARASRIIIRSANAEDREEIYRLRHEVYARELGQHQANASGRLSDALDEFNVYLVASLNGVIAGFISITPPEGGHFSVDKYIRREEFEPLRDGNFHEVRLLTVINGYRGREIACGLMYGAFRWVEAHGGERVVAIGRREILDLYLHVGMERLGRELTSGAVHDELLASTVTQLRERQKEFAAVLRRLERQPLRTCRLYFSHRCQVGYQSTSSGVRKPMTITVLINGKVVVITLPASSEDAIRKLFASPPKSK
jgi:hypothetical protein